MGTFLQGSSIAYNLRLFIKYCFYSPQVVKQVCTTDGVEPHYIREEVLPHFFKHFWNHRMALDRRNFRQVNRFIF